MSDDTREIPHTHGRLVYRRDEPVPEVTMPILEGPRTLPEKTARALADLRRRNGLPAREWDPKEPGKIEEERP